MLDKLFSLIRKYKEQFTYLVFGALTTLVSWAGYYVLYERLLMENVPATIIAELTAITFAFVTNKIWVFESSIWHGRAFWKEAETFYACRSLAFFVKVGFMYLTVNVFLQNAMLMQICITVVVVIINYFVSKYMVFKNK